MSPIGVFASLLCSACAPSVPAVDCGVDADCGANAFCFAGQCLQGTRTCPIIEPTYSSINRSLFRISCGITGVNAINCHAKEGAATASGLDLATDAYSSLVGVPAITTFLPGGGSLAAPFNLVLVKPGDGSDEGSFLIRKLHLPIALDPTFGAAMPADQPPGAICADTIAVIQQWIAQGAPRN